MLNSPDKENLEIYTIGHSNHDLEKFIKLLKGHRIDIVADVRSKPYSRFSPQFNRQSLEKQLKSRQIEYLFPGNALGGRPERKEFYDETGVVDYKLISRSSEFTEAIRRVLPELGRKRVALMCAEENPTDCHRRLLVGKALEKKGVKLLHIRGDGKLQTEEEVHREAETSNQVTT